eukprot:TRINITY_DN11790_c0_g1_i1.p1 TRINITY_DN11790_c0_g1~~TRINITY_DN11790_c0_g1_i1.p1  ORF type:complete len:190 (-),score=75.24 TRINITY_DN11790_c0_g1_i1:67-636(-)
MSMEEDKKTTTEAAAPAAGSSEGVAAAAAPQPTQPMDVLTALKEVLKKSLVHDGLARGLHEGAKALDRRQAHLCVLAANCSEPAYVALVEALCLEHSINLIKVPDARKLGEWVGLCKIDKEGHARKVVACSCVVVKEYGEETDALSVLLDQFKTQKVIKAGEAAAPHVPGSGKEKTEAAAKPAAGGKKK